MVCIMNYHFLILQDTYYDMVNDDEQCVKGAKSVTPDDRIRDALFGRSDNLRPIIGN